MTPETSRFRKFLATYRFTSLFLASVVLTLVYSLLFEPDRHLFRVPVMGLVLVLLTAFIVLILSRVDSVQHARRKQSS